MILAVAMVIMLTPLAMDDIRAEKVFTSLERVGDSVADGAGVGQSQPEQSQLSPKVVSSSSHVLYCGIMLMMCSHVNPSQKHGSDVGDGVDDGAVLAVEAPAPPPPPPHKQHIVFEVKIESS